MSPPSSQHPSQPRTPPPGARGAWLAAVGVGLALGPSCGSQDTPGGEGPAGRAPAERTSSPRGAAFGAPGEGERAPDGPRAPLAVAFTQRSDERALMVERQLRARDIHDERVLAAMGAVPRHVFVPPSVRPHAYADGPLPIGEDQTISQPYIVALMTQTARVREGDRVLEVGTGSGYQAAVLGELTPHVWSVEIVEPLGRRAREVLDALGYEQVVTRIGDGYAGWPEHGPFDAILVTAAPEHVPEPLVEQLAVGGRMVIPVGPAGSGQELLVLEKQPDGTVTRREMGGVRFVPMTGEAEGREDR